MPQWLATTFAVLLALLPGGLWMAFWFFAVDWKKVWPVLRAGAWAPVVLLIVVTALVWSRINPTPWTDWVHIANFWWQLYIVLALTAVALFSGWLQGFFGYEPSEVPIEPPPLEEGGHH